jgi:predicted RND superfamily exporter protein
LKLKLFTILFILGNLILGIYGQSITQVNPETIFLTDSGKATFQKFQDIIAEDSVLVVKFSKTAMPRSDWDRIDLYMEELADQHGRDEYSSSWSALGPRELYPPSFFKLSNEERIEVYKEGQVSARLIGENHYAYLLRFKESAFEKVSPEIISTIESSEDLNRLGVEVSMAGLPKTNLLLDRYSADIQAKLFPIMFISSFILCFLISGHLISAFLIFLPGLFAAFWGLAFLKAVFGSMNMITSIIPLLLFTISLAFAFHVFFCIRSLEKFSKMLELKLRPLILMVVTTGLGLSSLVISEISVIRQFGWVSAILLALTCSNALLWFHLIKDLAEKYFPHGKIPFTFSVRRSLGLKWIALLVLGVGALGIYSIPQINVLTDATRYFPEERGERKEILEVLESVVMAPQIEILIDRKNDNLSQTLRSMEVVEEELKAAFGANSLLSLHKMLLEGNYHYAKLKEIPRAEQSLKFMLGLLPEEIAQKYYGEKWYRITLLGVPVNTNEYARHLNRVEEILKKHDLKYEVNGLYLNLMRSQDAMIGLLVKSFGVTLLIITLLAFLYYRKWQVIGVFLLVNLLPAVLVLSSFPLFGLSLNIATVMTFSIALGMVVDSTIHLVHLFNETDKHRYCDFSLHTISPIFYSSILLIICFMSFGFHGFLPIKQFGITLALCLLVGLIADLYLLPTLFFKHHRLQEVFDEV